MKLHIPYGTNPYCGPAALSIITGKSTDEFTRFTKPSGGMDGWEMEEALGQHGFYSKFKWNPTPYKWSNAGFEGYDMYGTGQFTLRKARMFWHADCAPQIIIAAINKHWVVIDRGYKTIQDNGAMFEKEPQALSNVNHRWCVYGYVQVKF